MQYQILDWDTDFFGLKVARITEPTLEEQELSEIISDLKAKGVNLVYWSSSREIEEVILKQYDGILADKKITFTIDLESLNYKKHISTDIVEAFKQSMRISDIQNLAFQSGEHSRFVVDNKIPREKFLGLYSTWIRRSLNKEISEEVFVIRDGKRVVGMVTLGNKNGRGDIGLLAVDRNYRGKQYGQKLVHASQLWFINSGYQFSQVVTQGANIPACNLYKKCGYSVEAVEYFYHFWPKYLA